MNSIFLISLVCEYHAEAAEGIVEVEIEKPYNLNLKRFGNDYLLVRHETKANKTPQYIFVDSKDRVWATNRVNIFSYFPLPYPF